MGFQSGESEPSWISPNICIYCEVKYEFDRFYIFNFRFYFQKLLHWLAQNIWLLLPGHHAHWDVTFANAEVLKDIDKKVFCTLRILRVFTWQIFNSRGGSRNSRWERIMRNFWHFKPIFDNLCVIYGLSPLQSLVQWGDASPPWIHPCPQAPAT